MGLRRWSRRVARVLAGMVVLAGVLGLMGPAAAAQQTEWVATVARFEPLNPATTGLSADSGAGHRGALELRPGGALIAELSVDDYVRGIQEIPSSWPAAAQRAQAIAARTYSLNRAMAARRAPGWNPAAADLCATEQCQVYTGIQSERRPTGAAWQASVGATAGHVLLHEGAPILAKYSASNGGRSVSGGSATLPSVDDPDDVVSPNHRWTQTLEPTALARVVGSGGRVIAADRQGDVAVLNVEEAGSSRDIRLGANDLYNKVNAALPKNGLPRVFPSDRYALAFRDGQVVADGNGYGHGVGMGQWGAMGKAKRGLDHPAILSSYYGPARIGVAPPAAPSRMRVGLAAVPKAAVHAVPSGSAVPGGFRVKADGAVVAVVAPGGSWSVVAGPRAGTVKIVAPAGYTSIADSTEPARAAPAALPADPPPPTAAPEPPAPAPVDPFVDLPVFAMSAPLELSGVPVIPAAALHSGSESGAVLPLALGALLALGLAAWQAWRAAVARRRRGATDSSLLA